MGNESSDNLKELIYKDCEMWDKGNWDRVDDLYSEDYIEHYTGVKGQEGIKQDRINTKKAFPDLKLTIEDTVVQGNVIAVRYTIRGTHRGEFMGIQPTGKTFEIRALAINRTEDGKFAEHWGLYDIFSILIQLGVKEIPQGL